MQTPNLGDYVDWRQLYAESKAAGMVVDKKKKRKVKDRKNKEDISLDRNNFEKKETLHRRIRLTNNATGQVSKSDRCRTQQ